MKRTGIPVNCCFFSFSWKLDFCGSLCFSFWVLVHRRVDLDQVDLLLAEIFVVSLLSCLTKLTEHLRNMWLGHAFFFSG